MQVARAKVTDMETEKENTNMNRQTAGFFMQNPKKNHPIKVLKYNNLPAKPRKRFPKIFLMPVDWHRCWI